MPGPRSATFDFFFKIFEKFIVKNILGPQALSKKLNIDEKLYFAKDMLLFLVNLYCIGFQMLFEVYITFLAKKSIHKVRKRKGRLKRRVDDI